MPPSADDISRFGPARSQYSTSYRRLPIRIGCCFGAGISVFLGPEMRSRVPSALNRARPSDHAVSSLESIEIVSPLSIRQTRNFRRAAGPSPSTFGTAIARSSGAIHEEKTQLSVGGGTTPVDSPIGRPVARS